MGVSWLMSFVTIDYEIVLHHEYMLMGVLSV